MSVAGTEGGLRTLVCLGIVFTVVGGMICRSQMVESRGVRIYQMKAMIRVGEKGG